MEIKLFDNLEMFPVHDCLFIENEEIHFEIHWI